MSRTEWYCGPHLYIKRSDLIKLEKTGKFVGECKQDGYWCALYVDNNGPRSHKFESRTGNNFDGADLMNLRKVDMAKIGAGTILIGELEAGTQAANIKFERIGFRRIWLHDIVMCRGKDLRKLRVIDRQKLLRTVIWPLLPDRTKIQLPLIEQTRTNFVEFYDRTLAKGDEGMVLKRWDVHGWPSRSNGKSDEWFRIKPKHTVDYVVMGPERTKTSGSLTAQLGLYVNGQLTPCLTYQLPEMTLLANGRLKEEGRVVQMIGYEVHRSGAVRSAQFDRWRPDKSPEMCTGDITRVAEI
jgi:ATP-dependent DNA ligase